MPEPERKPVDLNALVRDAVLLQESGQPGVHFAIDLPAGPVAADLDATMISQALTNLIKNAGEAIDDMATKGVPEGFVPEIRVSFSVEDDAGIVRIADNGIGLPEDRARLFEPYVTTRDHGTGLGLPIVKKIIEEHGGTLDLRDAAPFAPGAHRGALAEIRLPVAPAGKAAESAVGQPRETTEAVSGE
jgi:two-component system nitrogen regulation sensor histidine kinase NtrY